MTRMTNDPMGAAKELPADLRQWVDECHLIKLALEATQRVFSRTAEVGMPTGVALNPQMMLTLLTYSYAAGMHASQDIEWFLYNDPVARYICVGNYPEELSIRRFRRANRQMIEHCLLHVFTEACKLKLADVGPREGKPHRLDAQTYASILEAARRRLQLAVLMDTAASE